MDFTSVVKTWLDERTTQDADVSESYTYCPDHKTGPDVRRNSCVPAYGCGRKDGIQAIVDDFIEWSVGTEFDWLERVIELERTGKTGELEKFVQDHDLIETLKTIFPYEEDEKGIHFPTLAPKS